MGETLSRSFASSSIVNVRVIGALCASLKNTALRFFVISRMTSAAGRAR